MADVHEDAGASRYLATVDGTDAGYLEYHDRGTTRSLVHTAVEADFEGHGIGSALARRALQDARDAGRSVLPICPFVRSYLDRHPEYVDLVPAGERARFGLEAAASG